MWFKRAECRFFTAGRGKSFPASKQELNKRGGEMERRELGERQVKGV